MKIIWAVNALELGSVMKTSMPRLLRSFVGLSQAVVEPVFILTPDAAIGKPTRLRESLRRARGLQFNDPKIFIEDVSSVKKTVKAFCRYAEFSKADLIVVSTFGTTKIRRLILSKFVKLLTQQSRIPVLAVSSNSQFKGKWSRILFPTNFSKHSEYVFDRVIELARILKADITVYHETSSPRNIQAQHKTVEFQAAVNSVPSAWVNNWVERRSRMEKYVNRARQNGVTANTFLDVGGLPLHEAILRAARKLNVQLIATASLSGSVKSLFSGAVTSRIVKSARCPVWILHEKALF